MLRASLEELITTAPNWRKLGGRFRRTVSVMDMVAKSKDSAT